MDGDESGQGGGTISRTVWVCPVCLREIREDGVSTEPRYCEHHGMQVLMVRTSLTFGGSSSINSE